MDIKNLSEIMTDHKENSYYIDYFNESIGYIPNIYKIMMYSRYALPNYYAFHTKIHQLSNYEINTMSLALSVHHNAKYNINQQSMIFRLNGYNEKIMLEIIENGISSSHLSNVIKDLLNTIYIPPKKENHNIYYELINQGYSIPQILDIVLLIGDNIITSLLEKVFAIELDYPVIFNDL